MRAQAIKQSEEKAEVPSVSSVETQALVLRLAGEGRRVLKLSPDLELAHVLHERQCQVVAVAADLAQCTALRRHCAAVIRGNLREIHLPQYLHNRRFDVVVVGPLLARDAPTDPVTFLRKLAIHLAPDGFLIASVPNLAHGSQRLALLDGALPTRRGQLRFYTLRELEQTLLDAGLMLDTVERVVLDPFRDPLTGAQRWDPASIPEALQHLIERDPEAAVAEYVVRARPAQPDEL
ncbi:MAG: class I SAM-dependent methyltransferase, partial [Myxococcota bacterium]